MTWNKTRERESETERERFWGEREQHSGKRKWRGLISTVGLNQQRLLISMTPENFLRVSINMNNRITANQDLGWH